MFLSVRAIRVRVVLRLALGGRCRWHRALNSAFGFSRLSRVRLVACMTATGFSVRSLFVPLGNWLRTVARAKLRMLSWKWLFMESFR